MYAGRMFIMSVIIAVATVAFVCCIGVLLGAGMAAIIKWHQGRKPQTNIKSIINTVLVMICSGLIGYTTFTISNHIAQIHNNKITKIRKAYNQKLNHWTNLRNESLTKMKSNSKNANEYRYWFAQYEISKNELNQLPKKK